MKNDKLSKALGQIDEKLIADAMGRKKKKGWVKWAAMAACLCLAAAVGWQGYRKIPQYMQPNSYYVWPWEYRTDCERYLLLKFDGNEYSARGRSIDPSFLQERLGEGVGSGYDDYTEQSRQTTMEVWKIRDIEAEMIVAAGINGEYYVYRTAEHGVAETLGELLDCLGLENNLSLSRFDRADADYLLEEDEPIWNILNSCAQAALYEGKDSYFRTEDAVSFCATSEALGVYKKVFTIYGSGYVSTNILEYGYVYFIGKENARQIIDYAVSHCTKTDFEPYQLTLTGEVTEIGEDYILVDDSILHWYGLGGTVYKVYLEDIRTQRYVTTGRISVGDMVMVTYEGYISEENEVFGAIDLQVGILADGDVLIPG